MKCTAALVVLPLTVATVLSTARSGWAADGRAGLAHGFAPGHTRSFLTGHSHGGVAGSQGYLGIGFRDVSDDRISALKLREAHGAEVIHIDHDGPASQAGLREHDVILQVNGQAVEGEEQLRRILHEIPIGRSISMVLSRDGQQLTITTMMADRSTVERQAWEQRYSVPEPQSPGYRGGNGFLGGAPVTAPEITAPPDPPPHSLFPSVILSSAYTGAALEAIGPQLAQFFGSQGGNGLLVHSVDPKSPAATAGLRAGDVIVRANAGVITTTGEWYKLVHTNKGKPLSIVVVRDKQEQTLVLVPDSKKRSSVEYEAAPVSANTSKEQAQLINAGLIDMD